MTSYLPTRTQIFLLGLSFLPDPRSPLAHQHSQITRKLLLLLVKLGREFKRHWRVVSRSSGFGVKCSTEEEEELLEPSVLKDMVGPFQDRKRTLVSTQGPLMVQVKVTGFPATRLSRM